MDNDVLMMSIIWRIIVKNETIQEQIKITFEKKLSESSLFDEAEIKSICELLYQKVTVDKAVDSLYRLLGGEGSEDSST